MNIKNEFIQSESRLSIIVTVYNVAEYLHECLDSLLGQSVLPAKIILVDDGSTDGSGEICDKYAEKTDLFEVLHQENKGVSTARLVGLNKVITEYVMFVDADDFISKATVKTIQSYIEKGIDIITFGMNRYYDENYIRADAVRLEEGILNRDYLIEKVFPKMIWDTDTHRSGVDASLCNKAVKKQLYDGLFEKISNLNIHYGEDVGTVYFALLKANNIAVIKECLYFHRQKKKGILPQYLLDDEYIGKLHKLYDYMKKQLPDSEVFTKQLEYFYLHALEVRLHKYNDYRTRRQYVFPFDKVEKNKRIIIYGAGEVGQSYWKQLTTIEYCKEIEWVDLNYDKYASFGVKSPDCISNDKDIDYIVIAILSENAAENVKKQCISKGFPEEKIIWCIKC